MGAFKGMWGVVDFDECVDDPFSRFKSTTKVQRCILNSRFKPSDSTTVHTYKGIPRSALEVRDRC